MHRSKYALSLDHFVDAAKERHRIRDRTLKCGSPIHRRGMDENGSVGFLLFPN
jgi:hypothetical protein